MQENIKESSVDRIYKDSQNIYNNLKTSKNKWFMLAIILLNVCITAVAWVVYGNKFGVVSFETLFKSYEWKNLYLILAIILVILLLKTFTDYIFVSVKYKKRRYGLFLNVNSKRDFYECVSIGNRIKNSACMARLSSSGIDNTIAVEGVYRKNLINKLSRILYFSVVVVLTACVLFKKISFWLFLPLILAILIDCIVVAFIISFNKNSTKILLVISKLCKVLYNLKLVKNYEKLYNEISDKLTIYSIYLKSKRLTIILDVLANALVMFLRHFILFIILGSINIVNGELLFQVIVRCCVLDYVIAILPLPKGLFSYEILFLALFSRLFFECYVLWGMLMYRLFDFYIYGMIFIISKLFDFQKRRVGD